MQPILGELRKLLHPAQTPSLSSPANILKLLSFENVTNQTDSKKINEKSDEKATATTATAAGPAPNEADKDSTQNNKDPTKGKKEDEDNQDEEDHSIVHGP